MVFNIIITGIGGQGTISVGHLLGKIYHEAGHPVLAAETHGMSQRGGSVIFHLRVGEGAYSPVIPKGTADVIISGEPMEAFRAIEYLKPNGAVITNTYGILSPVAAQLKMTYPNLDEITTNIQNWPAELKVLNTQSMAEELGIARGENLILLGSFLKFNEIDVSNDAVKDYVVKRWPKNVDDNLKALEAGIKAVA